MGHACSSSEDAKARQLSRAIDKAINKDKADDVARQKLLLLGTGECGKSTILKQIQILHANGFPEQELEERKRPILMSILRGMHALAGGASQALFLNLDHKALVADFGFSEEVIIALRDLWQDHLIQTAFERRAELNVSDSLQYFMNDFERVSESSYRVTTQDILHMRFPTRGVVQQNFTHKQCAFVVVDVGGQRSERKKWINQFENVNAIIFISAISEYDQKLLEDCKQNRLKESMELFRSICTSEFFPNTTMILFLNKTDLFKEKIKRSPIQKHFPNYYGGASYEDGVKFMRNQFARRVPSNSTRDFYIHETCATDTNQEWKQNDGDSFDFNPISDSFCRI